MRRPEEVSRTSFCSWTNRWDVWSKIEQVLIHPKRKTFYIPERDFIHSVEAARVCLKTEMLQEHPDKTTIEHSDSDDESGPTVEKQREILRRQIKTNEWTSVSRHGRG